MRMLFRKKDREKTVTTILISVASIVSIGMTVATRRIWAPFIYKYIYPRRNPCELDAGVFRHPDCPGDSPDLVTLIVQQLLRQTTP